MTLCEILYLVWLFCNYALGVWDIFSDGVNNGIWEELRSWQKHGWLWASAGVWLSCACCGSVDNARMALISSKAFSFMRGAAVIDVCPQVSSIYGCAASQGGFHMHRVAVCIGMALGFIKRELFAKGILSGMPRMFLISGMLLKNNQ